MFEIDWSGEAETLRSAADAEMQWNESVARSLVRSGDRLAVDIGCGGGGMAKALATALGGVGDDGEVVAIDHDEHVLAQARDNLKGLNARTAIGSLDDGPEPLRAAIGALADLVWAAHATHHAGDQQACVDSLAALLKPGGRLALAEGGLPTRNLPWDIGIGEPGLELRLDLANDKWYARMRAELPGSVPMPYGWQEALRRAGLRDVTSRTVLTERPTPLSDEDRAHVVTRLTRWVGRIRDTGFLSADDLGSWDQLLDEQGPHWLGRRTDLHALSASTIHIGTR